MSAWIVPGVRGLLGSLFAFFLYMVTALAAITGFMIAVFGDSTLGKVLHYPRPIVERTAATENPRRQLFMFAAEGKPPAKNTPETDVKSSSVASDATADVEQVKRPAHPRKLAARRENSEGRGYNFALSYGATFGYRPGLDGQR